MGIRIVQVSALSKDKQNRRKPAEKGAVSLILSSATDCYFTFNFEPVTTK